MIVVDFATKKKENIRHILSNCDKLAEGLYTTRHNNVLKVLYWKVLHEYKLESITKPWNCVDQPELERSNDRVIVKWNAKVYCEDYTSSNKPDMIIIDNEKKIITVVECSCPWDKNLTKKFKEKQEKYQVVRQQLKQQFEGHKVQQLNLIIGCLGTITTLDEELSKIFTNKKIITKLIQQMQRVVLISSTSIVDKFLKRE